MRLLLASVIAVTGILVGKEVLCMIEKHIVCAIRSPTDECGNIKTIDINGNSVDVTIDSKMKEVKFF